MPGLLLVPGAEHHGCVSALQVPYFPPLQSAEQFTPALCSELIRAAAGFTQQQQQQQGQPIRQAAEGLAVHSIKQWVMSAEVAEEYAAWGNRLLLAGDAAHRWGGRMAGRQPEAGRVGGEQAPTVELGAAAGFGRHSSCDVKHPVC